MEIKSIPVQVIPRNTEQKEYFESNAYGSSGTVVAIDKPQISIAQQSSIPDIIDGNVLSVQNKQELLLDKFTGPINEISYIIDDKGYIKRENGDQQNDNDKSFVNFEDVTFNMKKSQLNEQNFDYLKNSLKYLGFGENLNSALEARLKEGSDKFTLGATAVFDTPNTKDIINYELRFSKSNSTDNYFLNNYQATLEKGSINNKEIPPVARVFELNKGNDITAKEAYNLLSGRSIQKNAEVTDKLSILVDNVALTQVFKMAEAKDKIQEFVKSNPANSYAIAGKNNIIIKSFDKNGKEVPVKNERQELQLLQSKGKEVISFDVKDAAGIKQTLKDLIKDKDTTTITLTEKGVPIALYDNKGKELELEPTKRKEEVWMKLDFEKKNAQGEFPFKTFFQNYGFDLEKSLSAHPIKDLADPEKRERLFASLKRGNLQTVTLDKGGNDEKAFVAANPQYKNINLYDKDLKAVFEKQVENKADNQEDKGYQRNR